VNRAQRRASARKHVGRGGASGHVTRQARKILARELRPDVMKARAEAEEQAAEREVQGPIKQRRSGLLVFRGPAQSERQTPSGLLVPR
jgi:hypothetical protein